MSDIVELERKGRTNLRLGRIYKSGFPRLARMSGSIQIEPAKLTPTGNDYDYPGRRSVPDAIAFNEYGSVGGNLYIDRFYEITFSMILIDCKITNYPRFSGDLYYWVTGNVWGVKTGLEPKLEIQYLQGNNGNFPQPNRPNFVNAIFGSGENYENQANYWNYIQSPNLPTAPQPDRASPDNSQYQRIIRLKFRGTPDDYNGIPLSNSAALSGSFGDLVQEGEYYSKGQWYQLDVITKSQQDPRRPNYLDFVKGYFLDPRIKLDYPEITPSQNESATIGYYRWNKLEKLTGLTTIDWVVYEIELVKGRKIKLPIVDCVLNTLVVLKGSGQLEGLISAIDFDRSIYYEPFVRVEGKEAQLMVEWNVIRNNKLPPPLMIDYNFDEVISDYRSEIRLKNKYFRRVGAINNFWSNRPNPTTDLTSPYPHPLFELNNQLAYERYIEPQANNNFGILVMDSPRIIEIHVALDAAKNSIHKTNAQLKKENNLGFLINNIARVLGVRFDDNGDLDLAEEKKKYLPQTVGNSTLGAPSSSGKYNNYGMSSWGKIGMILPYLPTTYNKAGREEKLYDVVHDLPQLLGAILRQLDHSLSIQHGSEIRISSSDGKVQAYPNQLAINLEQLRRLEKISLQVERNLLVSTVTGSEIRELFSGIGVPVTQKFIPLQDPSDPSKSYSLPHFGHQKSQPSIANLLANVQLNVAVINGILLPKAQPKKNVFNPFERFKVDKK